MTNAMQNMQAEKQASKSILVAAAISAVDLL